MPHTRPTTFNEFRHAVRRLRPNDLLVGLARLACHQGFEPYTTKSGGWAHPWTIATAAREAILHGTEHRKSGVDWNRLRHIFNTFANIKEPGDQDAHAFLTRYIHEQVPYQETLFEELARTHCLFIDGPREVPNLKVLTPDNDWSNVLGAPIGQAFGATLALHTIAYASDGWLNPDALDHPDNQVVYESWPRAAIEARNAALSATPDEFRLDYRQAPAPPTGYERFAYNPLTKTPFIVMPNGHSLAPQPRLIMRTITPGSLYYVGMRAWDNDFGNDLGHLVEWYVGKQLATIPNGPTPLPEITYGKNNAKTTDWILVFPDLVVLIEVKSARYGLLDRAAVDGFDTRLGGLLNKAQKQILKTNNLIETNHPALKHVPADRPRIGISVTAEPYYLANSDWVRDLLNDAPIPTLIASLRDLETLVTLQASDVSEQLLRIANDPEHKTWFLQTALVETGTVQGDNPLLQTAFDNYPWPPFADSNKAEGPTEATLTPE